jgi:hypothetical protein
VVLSPAPADCRNYPNLKVVFMSGYASDLYAHDNIPGFNEALLTKPFRRATSPVSYETL